MDLLAIWVLVCSTLAPTALLGLLLAVVLPGTLQRKTKIGPNLIRAAHAVAYWAIPEVQVLAIIVALLRLGSVVDVRIGAGFWFYSGMSISLFVAWRSFVLRPPQDSSAQTPSLP
jgi:paraquat-inducible protein A